jgi:hypothetical protein
MTQALFSSQKFSRFSVTSILFGTDSSYFPRGWQKGIYEEQAAIINQLVPSEDDRAAILGDNARRLLGMPAAKA